MSLSNAAIPLPLCRLTLQVLAVSFAATGLLFFLIPDATMATLSKAGTAFGDFSSAPASTLRFWLSLGIAYMVLVTALAWMAQANLHANRNLVALLALGKATSALTSLYFYMFSLDAFVYLANFYVDGGLTLIALAIWWSIGRFQPT